MSPHAVLFCQKNGGRRVLDNLVDRNIGKMLYQPLLMGNMPGGVSCSPCRVFLCNFRALMNHNFEAFSNAPNSINTNTLRNNRKYQVSAINPVSRNCLSFILGSHPKMWQKDLNRLEKIFTL